MFSEQIAETGSFVTRDSSEDPCSASADPVGNGVVDKCALQGLPTDQIGVFEASVRYPVTFLSGGNPALAPEAADTWTVGAVVTPGFIPNWTFAVDYFELDLEGGIGEIYSDLICFDPANTSNAFCDNIDRDATGNIAEIMDLTSNRGFDRTSGIDTRIQGVFETVSIDVNWTHVFENSTQESSVSRVYDCAGFYGYPCSGTFPTNRVTSNFNYSSGPFSAQLTWRWIEGTDNAAPMWTWLFGNDDPDMAFPYIDDEHYLDLGMAYRFNDHLEARFGVNNLFDNDPPMTASSFVGSNTDTRMFDVFGRSYYLSLAAHF